MNKQESYEHYRAGLERLEFRANSFEDERARRWQKLIDMLALKVRVPIGNGRSVIVPLLGCQHGHEAKHGRMVKSKRHGRLTLVKRCEVCDHDGHLRANQKRAHDKLKKLKMITQ